eukprot:scaffold5901_cov116-Cylindrotheca_fusiformis.AAC.14
MSPLSDSCPSDLLLLSGSREDPLLPLTLGVHSDSPKPDHSPYFENPAKKRPKLAPKKSVSFSSTSNIFLVPHSSEMTDEELDASFMTDEDYLRIDKENHETLELMKQRKFPVSQELYFRGLECSLSRPMKERFQRMAFVVHHVLAEQKRSGQLSQQWIDTFRSSFTDKSAVYAHQMGIWDSEALQADLMAEVLELRMKYSVPR